MVDFNEIKSKISSAKNLQNIIFEKLNNYDRIIVPKEELVDLCLTLKDEFRFDQLIDIVGVDRFIKENRFELIYNLWSNEYKTRLFINVKLDSKNPEIESLCKIWPTANWEEREAYDMFGIIFKNHPDLRRIYMMDEFEYFPLRKDYPLMGIPGAVELPKK